MIFLENFVETENNVLIYVKKDAFSEDVSLTIEHLQQLFGRKKLGKYIYHMTNEGQILYVFEKNKEILLLD